MKPVLLLTVMFASAGFASDLDLESYSESLNFAQVTHVTASQKPDGDWCLAATVRHNDQGWDHYADGWEVIDFQGKRLGFRRHAHPHDQEQPFTRSQCNIEIPKHTTQVIVRAKCNKHGFGGKPFILEL